MFSIICASIGQRYTEFKLSEIFKAYSGCGGELIGDITPLKSYIMQLGFGVLAPVADIATIDDNIVVYKHTTPSGIIIYQVGENQHRIFGYIVQFKRPSITALAQLVAHVTMEHGWCQFYTGVDVFSDKDTWILKDPATPEEVRKIYLPMVGKATAMIFEGKLRHAVKELQVAKFLKMIYK